MFYPPKYDECLSNQDCRGYIAKFSKININYRSILVRFFRSLTELIFIYGHVLRGEGGQRASSKVVFCKKVCFGVPEELLCVKIIYILHASKHELQYHIPTQALSEKFYFLIYQKLILYFQTFCVKMSKLR